MGQSCSEPLMNLEDSGISIARIFESSRNYGGSGEFSLYDPNLSTRNKSTLDRTVQYDPKTMDFHSWLNQFQAIVHFSEWSRNGLPEHDIYVGLVGDSVLPISHLQMREDFIDEGIYMLDESYPQQQSLSKADKLSARPELSIEGYVDNLQIT